MIIETRNFIVQFPRRADLSGIPYGLLVVRKKAYLQAFHGHPMPRNEWGFHIPHLFKRSAKIQEFESCQLVQQDFVPHAIAQWPEANRKCAEEAAARKLAEMEKPRVVKSMSRVDQRIDLSGRPLQLWYGIRVAA